MSGPGDDKVYTSEDERPHWRRRPVRVRSRWRRRPVRVQPDHHADDALYWARVAVRHAARAERKAAYAEKGALFAVALAAGVLVAKIIEALL